MTLRIEYSTIHTFEYEGDVVMWDTAKGPPPTGDDIPSLVTHRMEGTWDVTEAQDIVKDRPVTDMMFPAELDSLGKNVTIDEEYAMAHSDLNEAIIAVVIHVGDSHDFFVIDGWHRIFKARQLGVNQLPVHILNEAESERVTLSWKVTPL
ncbi:hypothetical protein LCGC14_2221760 [marine sediment metagenome]|uniref:ParB/Sulfiredoxin domain-containing protein n=1 Tax=marine sediment metagenome TaxID=412755 RepID=A0A0F9DAW9_9ZZZZ